jgi:hypothetical protein
MNPPPTLARLAQLTCIAMIAICDGVSLIQQAHGGDQVQSPPRTESPVLIVVPAQGVVSPDVKPWIAAFPRDTETIVQANSFELTSLPNDIAKYDWPTIIEGLTLSPVLRSRVSDEMLRLLSGRTVRWALYGGRHYVPIDSFGSSSGEDACIFVLDESLGDVRGEIRSLLHEEHVAVRTASNREIIALPPPEGRRPKEKWEGTFVTFWDDRTIIVATSEQFLRQLLQGMTNPPAATAVGQPATAYWAAIPPDADAWLIHRCVRQPVGEDRSPGVFGGVVWSLNYKKQTRSSIRFWSAEHVKVETLEAKLKAQFDENAFRQMNGKASPLRWKTNRDSVDLFPHLAEPNGEPLEKWMLMIFLNAQVGMDNY